jgi:glycosyltransferase involved in cell wall biosynthesis
MKIGFVSLMRVASWGGSEELWSKTALRALAEGHNVETLTYSYDPISLHIAKLREVGVDTKFYQQDSSLLLDRMAVKLGVKKKRSANLPILEADVYVISCGSTWDFVIYNNITDKVIATGKPYILLSHNSLESGAILNDSQREYAVRAFEGASKVLFVSERNRRCAERQMAYYLPKAQIVSNPIRVQEIAVRPFPVSDKLLLAFVGTIECDFKGIDLLLEALSGEIWRSRDFHLSLYGKGPNEKYIQRLIELYNLQGKVSLQGYVNDVDRIWETSQALVLSSTSEGVPMVVIEAMLSGRAVLSTDVGAAERYVKDGETGYLVSAAKARYLAEGLEKLWQNRTNLQQMGEKAFAHARAITEMDPIKKFLSLIESASDISTCEVHK